MDLVLVNKIFYYALPATHLALLAFFLWQIHLIAPTRRFFKKLAFWQKGELPGRMLLGGTLFLLLFDVAYVGAKTGFQYWAWKTGGPLSQAFLPPATPITYFLGYVGFRVWLPMAINIIFALAFFLAIYISRKNQQRFFYGGEEYLAAISFLAVGWPGIIVYVPLVFLFMVGVSLFNALLKKSRYTSFLHFWIPLALFALLFGNQIIKMLGLQVLFIVGS